MKAKQLKRIKGMMKSNGEYEWKFSTIGGVTRVSITSGEDIAHLEELDKKLWTVLSCPANSMEIDQKSLSFMDSDQDGRIHSDEVVAVSKWLSSVLTDMNVLTARSSSLELSNFRTDTEEGRILKASAEKILEYLGKTQDKISISDVENCLATFSSTGLNGDGIITPATSDDASLKQIISECIATVGSVTDRSGAAGVNAELVETFFTRAAEWCEWKSCENKNAAEILPLGENTASALALCNSLSAKIDDFFLRCSLAGFSAESAQTLDVSKDRIASVSEKNLTECVDEISSFPLAHVSQDGLLSLTSGVNPLWSEAICNFKKTVVLPIIGQTETLSKEQWHKIQATFIPYKEWLAAEKGAELSSLGLERLQTIVAENRKNEILELIAQDKSLENCVASFVSIEKLLYLTRDFYTLVRNYVTFSDFYSSSVTGIPAVFQSGKLYIDQRCCDLCLDVADMGKHNASAASCGMFLIYCDCCSRHSDAKKSIVAVMTDGDIKNLKVGKNAIYYDRAGRDWDAVVTKIVDNPISLRQSFWSPYRKMSNFIEQQINKFAAAQDKKVTDKSLADISKVGAHLSANSEKQGSDAQSPQPQQTFDIAKYTGIFAMVGMALGTIGGFLTSLFTSFFEMKIWQMPLVIAAIILIISGPAMLLDWLKIRKRDISPLLNANGWAINANLRINIRFGTSLTHIARTPLVVTDDPFADKKMPVWKKVLIYLAFAIGLLVGAYFLIPKDKRPCLCWEKAQTEQTCVTDSVTVAQETIVVENQVQE